LNRVAVLIFNVIFFSEESVGIEFY
jgi:hypothetical protein